MNKLKNIKDSNIIYYIYKFVITFLFSLTLSINKMINFEQNLRSIVVDIYFKKFNFNYVIYFIVSFILIFSITTIIEKLIPLIKNKIYIQKENKICKINVFFVILFSMLLMWLPYILTYFPGGIFSDTLDSIKQCLGLKPYNNNNPILYTVLIKICLVIGNRFGSHQLGISIFCVFQILLMASILSYFIYWLYKKRLSKIVLIIIFLFFSSFKLIPLYAMSIWKDTIFSIVLFAYIIFIADIVLTRGNNIKTNKTIIVYSLFVLILSFLRNNGLYVLFATTLLIIFIYRKLHIKKFIIIVSVMFILVYIIKGPIFSRLGLNNAIGGYNAIKLQQIFYVSVKDGNITKKQQKIIDNMYIKGKNELEDVYAPFLLDVTAIDPQFNNAYVTNNVTKINELWLELMIKNPKLYMESYLLNTLGFWNVKHVFPDAYVSDFMWPGTEEIIDVEQIDVIKSLSNKSIKKYTKVNYLYSSAIFLFIIIFSSLFAVLLKKYYNLIIYMPSIFTWCTIMLATPIAFSLRYVYILVLMVPFSIVIPFLKLEEIDIKQ